MKVLNRMTDLFRIHIVCADPEAFLSKLCANGLSLRHITIRNQLYLDFTIDRYSMDALNEIALKQGVKIEYRGVEGTISNISSLLFRPIILVCIFALLVLTMVLPTRVLFVQVQGNTNIPTKLILEKAEQCGIYFGANRKEVRSEKVKNAILSSIPQLRWAGVNTYGTVAVISVRERDLDKAVVTDGVGCVVAAYDGIIKDVTVTKGMPLCKVGQAVKAGEKLISGYTDCGFSIRAELSEGSVVANTLRKVYAVTPNQAHKPAYKSDAKTRYMLRIGKNIIKLFKDSGISDTTCVKMYEEVDLVLFNDLCLPVGLIKEKISYASSNEQVDVGAEWLPKAVNCYLHKQMVCGTIINSIEQQIDTNELHCFFGEYNCTEEIGIVQSEEILTSYGKRN